MKQILVVTLAFVITIPVLSGCSKSKPNVDPAKIDLLAQKLLASISQNKTAEFYKQNFAPSLKDRMSLKDWELMAEGYRKHLGGMVELDRYATHLQETDFTVEASCSFYVKWEKDEGKLELSLSKENNQDWQIVSLNISSKTIASLEKKSEDDYKKEASSMAAKKKPDISTSAPSIPAEEEK